MTPPSVAREAGQAVLTATVAACLVASAAGVSAATLSEEAPTLPQAGLEAFLGGAATAASASIIVARLRFGAAAGAGAAPACGEAAPIDALPCAGLFSASGRREVTVFPAAACTDACAEPTGEAVPSAALGATVASAAAPCVALELGGAALSCDRPMLLSGVWLVAPELLRGVTAVAPSGVVPAEIGDSLADAPAAGRTTLPGMSLGQLGRVLNGAAPDIAAVQNACPSVWQPCSSSSPSS